MNAERFCVLALIALTIALIALATIAAEQVNASSINSAVAQSIDDTLYLRRGASNNLTTTEPSDSATSFTRVSNAIWRWINGTPSANWVIDGGNYVFRFWMDKATGSPTVTITFKFGYRMKDGTEKFIASITSEPFSPGAQPALYTVSGSGGGDEIPDESNLLLEVQVSATGGTINFHYDGYVILPGGVRGVPPTRIETPTIRVRVPEFPLGFGFLAPILLMGYFILRRFKRGL